MPETPLGSSRPSRRALSSGVAWSIPAVVIGAAAPAIALSQTAQQFAFVFDGGGGANGYLNSVYLNFGLASGQTSPFTLTAPVTAVIDVVGLLSTTNDERSFTAGSSNGATSRAAYDTTTHTTRITWVIPVGTVVGAIGTSSSLPDILFSFQDGLTSAGRLTNKIVVRSVSGATVTSPSAPPIDSSIVKDTNTSAVSPDGIY